MGLPNRSVINRIGDSENYIWLQSEQIFYKIDSFTGVVIEAMSRPNQKINWSSGYISKNYDHSNIFMYYSILDGWITDLQNFINPLGQELSITTIRSHRNDVFIGTSDGTIFHGDKTMRTLRPYYTGLSANHIYDLEGEGPYWIGGKDSRSNSGISLFDADRKFSENFIFNQTINLKSNPIYSILEMKKEVWFGTISGISVYNIKQDFWRQYSLLFNGEIGSINSMLNFNDSIWVATKSGLFIVDKKNKSLINHEITSFFKKRNVFNLEKYNDLIFIASSRSFSVFDTKNNKLFDAIKFGYNQEISSAVINNLSYSSIVKTGKDLFLGNRMGVAKFNFKGRKWSKVVDPSVFGGLEILSLAVSKELIFISTNNGLVQYDMKNKFIDIFNYNFLGQVNDIKINNRKIWLGTSKGLVSYKFK